MPEASDPSAFDSGSDELGIYARVGVDSQVFSEDAILKTAYWFTDQYYLFITKNRASGMVNVEFRLKEGDSLDALKKACGEFRNHILDQQVRQLVLKETGAVRDSLIKKAFFEVATRSPANMISDETHIPKPEQNYKEDPVRAGQPDR